MLAVNHGEVYPVTSLYSTSALLDRNNHTNTMFIIKNIGNYEKVLRSFGGYVFECEMTPYPIYSDEKIQSIKVSHHSVSALGHTFNYSILNDYSWSRVSEVARKIKLLCYKQNVAMDVGVVSNISGMFCEENLAPYCVIKTCRDMIRGIVLEAIKTICEKACAHCIQNSKELLSFDVDDGLIYLFSRGDVDMASMRSVYTCDLIYEVSKYRISDEAISDMKNIKFIKKLGENYIPVESP